MGLDLPGMIPAVDALVVRRIEVEFELFGRDLHRAFEHVQLRADGKGVEQRGMRAHLARQHRISFA